MSTPEPPEKMKCTTCDKPFESAPVIIRSGVIALIGECCAAEFEERLPEGMERTSAEMRLQFEVTQLVKHELNLVAWDALQEYMEIPIPPHIEHEIVDAIGKAVDRAAMRFGVRYSRIMEPRPDPMRAVNATRRETF